VAVTVTVQVTVPVTVPVTVTVTVKVQVSSDFRLFSTYCRLRFSLGQPAILNEANDD
jgi:hypothetical protein